MTGFERRGRGGGGEVPLGTFRYRTLSGRADIGRGGPANGESDCGPVT
jgi:hypothetical protein